MSRNGSASRATSRSASRATNRSASRAGGAAGLSKAEVRAAERIEMVRWAGELGAVTAEALAHRGGTTTASSAGRLNAAVSAGLLRRSKPLTHGPTLYVPTSLGMRESGQRGFDLCRVSASNAEHLIACAAVAAALERLLPDERVGGERALRRDEREHGAPLASAKLGIGKDGGPQLHRPDLVLWPDAAAGGLPVAVEVELTVKSRRRLEQICTAWARCRLIAGVIYLAKPDVEAPLRRAIDAACAQRSVAIVPLARLAPSCVS